MSVQFVVRCRIDTVRDCTCREEQYRLICLVNQSLHLFTCLCEVAIIDCTHFIQFVHELQSFFVLITCCNTSYFISIRIQSNHISYTESRRFGRNKGVSLHQPILHTGEPSCFSTGYSDSVWFHFQELLTYIDKFIGSSRNFTAHLLQIVGIYPHFSCVFTMETVIYINQRVDLSICLTGYTNVITVFFHHSQVVRNIFFCQIVIQRNQNLLFNTVFCDVWSYTENNIRIIIGLEQHVQFIFPVITTTCDEFKMNTGFFFHELGEIVGSEIFNVWHTHGEQAHIQGTVFYDWVSTCRVKSICGSFCFRIRSSF